QPPLLVNVFRLRAGILVPTLAWERFLANPKDVNVVSGHTLRAPECRHLQVAWFTSGERLIGGDLVPKAFRDLSQVLHRLILRLALLLLFQQRQRFLAEELQVQRRAIDFLFVIVTPDPIWSVEKIAGEACTIFAVPLELLSQID